MGQNLLAKIQRAKRTRKPVRVRMPVELWEQVKELAEAQGTSRNEIMLCAIEHFVEQVKVKMKVSI